MPKIHFCREKLKSQKFLFFLAYYKIIVYFCSVKLQWRRNSWAIQLSISTNSRLCDTRSFSFWFAGCRRLTAVWPLRWMLCPRLWLTTSRVISRQTDKAFLKYWLSALYNNIKRFLSFVFYIVLFTNFATLKKQEKLRKS